MSQAKPPFKASPPPPCKFQRRIYHVVERNVRVAGAVFTRQIYSRDGGGEGRVICESMPFDNGSLDLAQIQHKDGQWCSALLLF